MTEQGALAPRTQWSGAAGLAAFRRRVACAVRDPAAFRVRLREAETGGVRLAEWRCSELALDLAARDEVLIVHVVSGAVRCSSAARSVDAAAGDLLLLGAGEVRRLAVAGGSHLRTIALATGLVPPRLHAAPTAGGCAISPSPVTAAFATALAALCEAAFGQPVHSEFLGQSLRALVLAVLDDRRLRCQGTSGELRERIEHFVDSRLGDAALTPGAIASAFAVSLRWVHQAFNRDGETLAQYIRVRRADAVADEVRRGGWTAGTGALATAYGFSGREHLGRVFRSRYGMTVAEFQAAARAGLAPQPLAAPA